MLKILKPADFRKPTVKPWSSIFENHYNKTQHFSWHMISQTTFWDGMFTAWWADSSWQCCGGIWNRTGQWVREGVWIVHVHQWDMSCGSHAVKYWWPGPRASTCTCNASNISRFSRDLLANNQFSHLWNMHSSLLCIPPAVSDYFSYYEKLGVLAHLPHFATYTLPRVQSSQHRFFCWKGCLKAMDDIGVVMTPFGDVVTVTQRILV